MTDPPRRTIHDFDPDVLGLFDEYVHGQIDRRGFIAGAARLAIGASVATGLLAALSPRFALAQKIKPDDKRLKTSYLEFESTEGNGKARGYLVRPADAKSPLPLVLVVHENRGLNPHIEDVWRAGLRLRDTSPSNPTRCFHSADIQSMRTRHTHRVVGLRLRQGACGFHRGCSSTEEHGTAAMDASERSGSATEAA